MAPSGTARSIPATARVGPKDFSSPVASIASGSCVVMGLPTGVPRTVVTCQTQGPPGSDRWPATFCPPVRGRRRRPKEAGRRGDTPEQGPPPRREEDGMSDEPYPPAPPAARGG